MTAITFAYPDFESLGVGYLVSACRQAGYDAALVRYEAEDPYTAHRNRAFDPAEVAARIAATSPEIAAFSCVTHNFRDQLACARALKALRPETFVLFGGVHPTAVPARVLEHAEVDAVAIGEAERSLVDLLRRADRNGRLSIPGGPLAGFVRRGRAGLEGSVTEGALADLDALPFPEKRAFYDDPDALAHEYFVVTSRGCPYRCAYCFNSCVARLRGRPGVRRRSVENVLDELVEARRAYGIRNVHFLDDSFTAGAGWVRRFADGYRRRVGLPFVCSVNPELVDAAAVRALRDAGCVEVQLGVQSLSPRLCADVLDRRLDRDAIASAVRLLKAAGILVQTDMLLGVPGETLREHEEGLRFMNRLRPGIVSVFWLAYYPGTEILARAAREGWLTAEEIDRIERGEPLARGGLHGGWQRPGLGRFRPVAVLYNYLPLLPAPAVRLLLWTRLYRLLRLRGYALGTALPRAIRSLVDRRYFTGRGHLRRFFRRIGASLARARR